MLFVRGLGVQSGLQDSGRYLPRIYEEFADLLCGCKSVDAHPNLLLSLSFDYLISWFLFCNCSILSLAICISGRPFLLGSVEVGATAGVPVAMTA